MTDFAFLKISPNLLTAQDLGTSPEVENNFIGQIQLKPKDPLPYWQATNSNISLTVGNYTACLIDCHGNEDDVTNHIYLREFEENGITQLQIRVAYLPKDYYGDLVYLKIDRFGDDTSFYYSNKFLVTDEGIEKTSRIDYIDRYRPLINFSAPDSEVPNTIFYHSIRLRFYFENYVNQDDVITYFQVSKSQHINPRSFEKNLKQWRAEVFDAWTFQRLKRALLGVCYIGQIRNYIKEAAPYSPREVATNFSDNTFLTDPNYSDILNIAPVIIGSNLIDFRVNVPEVRINDPLNFLITQSKIPQ